jgi:hypothetical protein
MVFNLSCQTKSVFRVANGSTEKLQEWPDFWSWLSSEVQRLSNLFDSEGKEYDLNTPTVPN